MSSQGRELLGDTDGDGVSMAANGGLTDAEGALSDVNSIYECGGGEAGDLDDTSLSSRASSRFFSLTICFCKTHFLRFRIFDSDQIYSADSLHGMYDRCFPSSHLEFQLLYECIQMCFLASMTTTEELEATLPVMQNQTLLMRMTVRCVCLLFWAQI